MSVTTGGRRQVQAVIARLTRLLSRRHQGIRHLREGGDLIEFNEMPDFAGRTRLEGAGCWLIRGCAADHCLARDQNRGNGRFPLFCELRSDDPALAERFQLLEQGDDFLGGGFHLLELGLRTDPVAFGEQRGCLFAVVVDRGMRAFHPAEGRLTRHRRV